MGSRAGRVVDVADVPMRFTATDAARDEVLHRFLAGFVPHPGKADASVQLRARLPAVPRRHADRVVDGFDVWAAGDTMAVRFGTTARATATDLTAVVGATDATVGGVLPVAFLFVATHLLAQRDRFLLHGGAVVHHGEAFIVLGPTGAGKSTLVAAALGTDWDALADDMVVVWNRGRLLAVEGIPRSVAVPPELGHALAGGFAVGDARRRRVVPATALVRGWFPVAGVIAVGHSASDVGALHRLGGHETLRLVLNSFTSVVNANLVRRFFGSAAAVSNLPGWRLELGADAVTRLDVARHLLGRVLDGDARRS